MNEFEAIGYLQRRLGTPVDAADLPLGIGDDAALIATHGAPAMAVCTDTLVAGRHFSADYSAADIGFRALSVNLSDFAAMGVRPQYFQLALTLPNLDAAWLAGFCDGMAALSEPHSLVLAGGDLTGGPLCVSVTLFGATQTHTVLTRTGARVGDRIMVSGQLGGPFLALAARMQGQSADPQCDARLLRPAPRVALGCALAGVANAAIDISDGLVQDLGHICRGSGVAMRVCVDAIPHLAPEDIPLDLRRQAVLAGGEEYELAFTVPAEHATEVRLLAQRIGVPIADIGEVRAADAAHLEPVVQVVDSTGSAVRLEQSGFMHFR